MSVQRLLVFAVGSVGETADQHGAKMTCQKGPTLTLHTSANSETERKDDCLSGTDGFSQITDKLKP